MHRLKKKFNFCKNYQFVSGRSDIKIRFYQKYQDIVVVRLLDVYIIYYAYSEIKSGNYKL